MITRLKLLQSKYSLSNEFIAKAIRCEIERQALLDINGIINNCSVTTLEDIGKAFISADELGATTAANNDASIDIKPRKKRR